MLINSEEKYMSDQIDEEIIKRLELKLILLERSNSKIKKHTDREMRNKIKEIIQNEVK